MSRNQVASCLCLVYVSMYRVCEKNIRGLEGFSRVSLDKTLEFHLQLEFLWHLIYSNVLVQMPTSPNQSRYFEHSLRRRLATTPAPSVLSRRLFLLRRPEVFSPYFFPPRGPLGATPLQKVTQVCVR